jgi:hypothetical protein
VREGVNKVEPVVVVGGKEQCVATRVQHDCHSIPPLGASANGGGSPPGMEGLSQGPGQRKTRPERVVVCAGGTWRLMRCGGGVVVR